LIVILCLGSAALLGQQDWPGLTFVFVMSGWILAVGVHEFCHAWVAWRGGDYSVVDKGYLSFDIRRYGNLQTTLIFPLLVLALGGIGFPGGAVYLREDLMRGRLWRSAASLAGPVGSLLVLLGLSGALALWPPPPQQAALTNAISFLAFLQATAVVLNLLPIPGLDGYGVIRPFLPVQVQASLRRLEPFLLPLMLIVIFLVPQATQVIFSLADILARAAGLALPPVVQGWHAFQFWK